MEYPITLFGLVMPASLISPLLASHTTDPDYMRSWHSADAQPLPVVQQGSWAWKPDAKAGLHCGGEHHIEDEPGSAAALSSIQQHAISDQQTWSRIMEGQQYFPVGNYSWGAPLFANCRLLETLPCLNKQLNDIIFPINVAMVPMKSVMPLFAYWIPSYSLGKIMFFCNWPTELYDTQSSIH